MAKLLDGLAGLTNLVVISHGWNNDTEEANELYDGFLESVEDIAAADIVPGRRRSQARSCPSLLAQ